jgi:cathepsin A (carboxypeptidase C)
MSETGDPATNPLVVWMNGGPGVSSLLGLWDEWGPRLFNHSKPHTVEFKDNPHAVTEKMSWVFLEQPGGVGYSRVIPTVIENSKQGAQDLSIFLDLFIRNTKFTHPTTGAPFDFQNAPFHIAGESYAGHYIPALGSLMVKTGQAKALKLQSIFIGNAAVDEQVIGDGLVDLICPPSAMISPTITFNPASLTTDCSRQMSIYMPLCSKAIEDCRTKKNNAVCGQVETQCESVGGGFWGTYYNKNPYDASATYSADAEQTEYYETPLKSFLNVPTRKKSFGIDNAVTWKWSNDNMFTRFIRSGDFWRDSTPELNDILNGNIDLMLFAVSTLYQIRFAISLQPNRAT